MTPTPEPAAATPAPACQPARCSKASDRNPVFKSQARHATELAGMVGDQRQAQALVGVLTAAANDGSSAFGRNDFEALEIVAEEARVTGDQCRAPAPPPGHGCRHS